MAGTLAGEIAGFRIPSFGSAAQCASLAALFEAEAGRVDSYAGSNVAAAHLGVPAIKYSNDAAGYFAAARRWNAWQHEVLGNGGAWDAAGAVVAMFAQLFSAQSCGVAVDAAAGSYFHGIIRNIDRSPLHNDYAHRDFPGWLIAACRQQLAWNVYLTAPGAGDGGTLIYRKAWQPSDEAFKHTADMGYDEGVVAGRETARYSPVAGDLLVFSCVNYHEVAWTRGAGRRLTVGGFIGIDDAAHDVRFWS